MRADTGEVHTVVGEYTEVRPPERIAYTWTWESNEGANGGERRHARPGRLRRDGDGTTVTLTHTGFTNPEIRGMHEHGWNGTLESLARYLAA